MLTTFQSQIARGGAVTVIDKDVTRFFMTVEEAVQLVIQASGCAATSAGTRWALLCFSRALIHR